MFFVFVSFVRVNEGDVLKSAYPRKHTVVLIIANGSRFDLATLLFFVYRF